MSVRRRRILQAAAILLAGATLPPTAALAGGGGAGVGPLSSTSASLSSNGLSATAANPLVGAGDITTTATGGGITISTRISGMLRGRMTFTGTGPAGSGGSVVEIERLGRQTKWIWAPTAHAAIASGGAWTVVWRPNHIGSFQFRAVVQSAQAASRRSGVSGATSSSVTSIVYRPSIATEYGPGEYGNETACGEILRPNTVGVANRTLPCGTPVAFYWKGRTITVPVIDRGPYANHADWDLTMAAGSLLKFPGKATLGAVSLPRR